MTDTRTPAELLTAAADRLEKLLDAPALTPGPWHNDGSEIYGETIAIWVGETLHLGDQDATDSHAAYIAAMNPTMGRALVAAIRSWATAAADEAAHGTNVAVVFAEELDVARAILGEPTGD